MVLIEKPGIYPEITSAQYFSGLTPTKCLTNSGIKILLNETPADYIGREDIESSAKRLGDVTHQLALGKGVGIIVSPYDEFRSNEAKAWRDGAIASGKTVVKQKDFDAASDMAEIVIERIEKALGGADYETEVPFYWIEQTEHGAVWCSGMLDVWCADLGIAMDPKITPYIHGDKARAHIANMGWHTQNAWYRRGLNSLLPDMAGKIQFKNLLISPAEPHTSRVVSISEGWRTGAEIDCERALRLFASCMASGDWPGYETEDVLDEPSWMMNARLMREIEDEE